MNDEQQLQVIQEPNQVKVITQHGKIVNIPWTGGTWEDLSSAITRAGIDLKNMAAVDGRNRMTYDVPTAEVSPGSFKLYLVTKKSELGSERTEAYAKAKELISLHGQSAKAYFGNYTNKATSVIQELLCSYKPYNIADVVESLEKGEDTPKKVKAVPDPEDNAIAPAPKYKGVSAESSVTKMLEGAIKGVANLEGHIQYLSEQLIESNEDRIALRNELESSKNKISELEDTLQKEKSRDREAEEKEKRAKAEREAQEKIERDRKREEDEKDIRDAESLGRIFK